MLVLEDLCKGRLQSQSVMIEDTCEAPGGHLLLALLHSLCQRCDQIILLAFERPPHFYLNTLPQVLREKVHVADIRPRPMSTMGQRERVSPLIHNVQGCIRGCEQRVGVVIDSVSTIVHTHSPTAVPQLIHSVVHFKDRGNRVQQVISLLHTDVHDDKVCDIVSSQVDTLIHLQPPSSPGHRYTCVVTHKDMGEDQMEEFNISGDFLHIQDVRHALMTEQKQSTTAEAQMDPAANLTFNLSLKPSEKAAKDQVVLPYTQVSFSEGQGGVIHYIPDDADDFDDEDPDDDLDF